MGRHGDQIITDQCYIAELLVIPHTAERSCNCLEEIIEGEAARLLVHFELVYSVFASEVNPTLDLGGECTDVFNEASVYWRQSAKVKIWHMRWGK